LLANPRGNESRADQRLSFPRPTAGRPLSGTAFEVQPTPRTASDRHSEIGRATKRTTRANLPNRPLLMSSATNGRAREAARIDGRSGVALRRCRRLHTHDLALPGTPLRRAEYESDSARRRANQSRVLNFILDRKQQYIWVRLGHSEDHPESYGSPSSYSARRLLWLGYPSR